MDTITRTNRLDFANGFFRIQVDEWPANGDEKVLDRDKSNCNVDHLMGSVFEEAFRTVDKINRRAIDKKLSRGQMVHVSTRSMTINNTTMRIKVTLTVTRVFRPYELALYVDGILTKMTACMIHLMDAESLNDDESRMVDEIVESARRILGGAAPDDLPFMGIPADLLAGMGFGARRAQTHQAGDGDMHGQYL